MKILFIDLETTGTDRELHGIHQLSGAIVINGNIVQKFDYKVAPHFGATFNSKALEVCGVNEDEIKKYPHMLTIYPLVIAMLCKHVDLDNPDDKFFIAGYNSQKFDAGHFGKWFIRCNGLKYFKQLFWTTTLDVMIFATGYLMGVRHEMENFKLLTVAAKVGIIVDKKRLHTADYDIELTMEIYRIVYGKY